MMAILAGSTSAVLAEPLITDYQEATSAYEDAYLTGSFNLKEKIIWLESILVEGCH